VIASPKGSAVCTGEVGAGVCATDGEGEGLAAGAGEAEVAGAGLAESDGEGVADGTGAGAACWASDALIPNQIAAAGINATRARRGRQGRGIQ